MNRLLIALNELVKSAEEGGRVGLRACGVEVEAFYPPRRPHCGYERS